MGFSGRAGSISSSKAVAAEKTRANPAPVSAPMITRSGKKTAPCRTVNATVGMMAARPTAVRVSPVRNTRPRAADRDLLTVRSAASTAAASTGTYTAAYCAPDSEK